MASPWRTSSWQAPWRSSKYGSASRKVNGARACHREAPRADESAGRPPRPQPQRQAAADLYGPPAAANVFGTCPAPVARTAAALAAQPKSPPVAAPAPHRQLSAAEAEEELVRAAAEADDPATLPAPKHAHAFAETSDEGATFHWAGTRKPIPVGSARHAAECRAYRAVEALDAARALSQAQRDTQSHARGVRVGWLTGEFAELCGAGTRSRTNEVLTSADVIAGIVRPATRARRCRYVELLAPADRGRASIYVSHAHRAPIADLIAALRHVAPADAFVWVDLFAVRMWPGSGADRDFRAAVRRSRALLLVCSDVAEIAEIGATGAEAERGRHPPRAVAERCALLRAWCVAEAVEAAAAGRPVVALLGRARREGGFAVDGGMLPALRDLVDVTASSAALDMCRAQLVDDLARSPGLPAAQSALRAVVAAAEHTLGATPVARAALSGSLTPLSHLRAPHRPKALRAASALGLVDALRYLLGESRADDVDPLNTSVEIAATCGHAPAVVALLGAGAAPSAAAVEAAAEHGHVDVLELLLARAANPFAHGAVGRAALVRAAYGGHVGAVELLLGRRVHVSAANRLGQTAMHAACANGHDAVVASLLARDADVNGPPSNVGQTPLMLACAFGHASLARSLLHHRAAINARTADGTSALEAAGRRGHREVVALLLDAGATGHCELAPS